MSQKVNPIAVRLRLNRIPDSSWFSDYYYSKLLYQDLNFREYVIKIRGPSSNKLGFRPGKCIIHLSPKKTRINLFCLSNTSQQQSEESFARVLGHFGPKDQRESKKQSIFTTKDLRPEPTGAKNGQSGTQNSGFVLPSFYEQRTTPLKRSKTKSQPHGTAEKVPVSTEKHRRSTEVSEREEEHKKRLSNILSTACRPTNPLKRKTIANYLQFIEIRRNTLACIATMHGYGNNPTNYDAHKNGSALEKLHNIALVSNLLNIYNIPAEVSMELDSNNSFASGEIKVPLKATSIPLVALDFSKFSYEVFHKIVEQTIQQKKTSEIEMRSWLLSICGLTSVLAQIKDLSDREQLLHSKQVKPLQTRSLAKAGGKHWTLSLPPTVASRHDFLLIFLTIYYFFLKFTHMNHDFGGEYSITNPLTPALFWTSSNAKKHLMTPVLLALMDSLRKKRKVESPRPEPTGGLWYPQGNQKQRKPDICFENKFFYLANLESTLNKTTNTTVKCKILKISSIYQSANLIAQEIACKLEQKKSFRQICRSIFQQITLCKYIKGIRISCSGRINGAEIAKTECRKYGETSLHVFSDKIDYASAKAAMPYGILGIKVWVSYI